MVDGSGNIVLAGNYMGTLDLGGRVISAGDITPWGNMFVVKLDPSGSYSWSKALTSQANVFCRDYCRSVAVGPDDTVVVTGAFQDEIDFEGPKLTTAGNSDVFVVKFGSDGAYQWSKKFGDGSTQQGRSVIVDASGDIVLTGWFGSSITFGGPTLVSKGSFDSYVAKLDADGKHLYSVALGSTGNVAAYYVVAGTDGSVVAVGSYAGELSVGTQKIANQGGLDVFVVKLNASGTPIWERGFGGPSTQSGDEALGVCGDPASGIYVVGYFGNTVAFDTFQLVGHGGGDIFAAKLDANGSVVWAASFGDASSNQGGIQCAVSGSTVTVTGNFAGNVDFGGTPLQAQGAFDALVLDLATADGAVKRALRFGTTGLNRGYSVAPEGVSLLVSGFFEGNADFGCGQTSSLGAKDIFVLRLPHVP